MAQRAEMAEKKKVQWDSTELDGLAKVGEITLEKLTAEIPGFKVIKIVQADITKNPLIEFEYVVRRDGSVLKFFEDFYNLSQVKDVTIIRTDALGNEFPGCKKMYKACECVKKVTPAYDAVSPTYCKINIVIIYDSEIQL